MGEGSTKDTRMVFTMIRKADCLGIETYNALWESFSWSFNALRAGKRPALDVSGRACVESPGLSLAGGFSGAMVLMRGDWQWYSEIMELPKHNEVKNMCYLCKAGVTDPTLRYTDARKTAGWRATKRTTTSFKAECVASGKKIPVLLDLIPGLQLEHIMVDILHTVDLGVTAHVLGNIMAECMRQMAATQSLQVDALNADLKSWYRRQGKDVYRLQGKITKDGMRTNSGFPKLKGKAAGVRHLSGYGVDLCRRYTSGNDHDSRRLAIAKLLQRFYVIFL